MTNATKLIAGLLLIAVTTIEYGGTFLLGILSGKYAGFTEFQLSMFRAGHAHAGGSRFSRSLRWSSPIRQACPPQSGGRCGSDSRRLLFW
jgi:hypothetical protein